MAQEPKQDAGKEEAAAEAPAKSSKKKLIIIIAAALLAVGGGGAGWYFMHQKPAGKVEKKHEEPPQAPVFVALETFTVNLQPDPDEKFLQLDATVQVANPEVAEHLKTQMPAVRNRLLMLLTMAPQMPFLTSLSFSAGSPEIAMICKKASPKKEAKKRRLE